MRESAPTSNHLLGKYFYLKSGDKIAMSNIKKKGKKFASKFVWSYLTLADYVVVKETIMYSFILLVT